MLTWIFALLNLVAGTGFGLLLQDRLSQVDAGDWQWLSLAVSAGVPALTFGILFYIADRIRSTHHFLHRLLQLAMPIALVTLFAFAWATFQP